MAQTVPYGLVWSMTTFDLSAHVPDIYRHLFAIDSLVSRSNLDPQVVELVSIRISQIRGCPFCLRLHLGRARAAGVDQRRLDLLAAWEGTDQYTAAERAALHFAETSIASSSGPAWTALEPHFDSGQIAMLTVAVGMTQAWTTMLRATGLGAEQAE